MIIRKRVIFLFMVNSLFKFYSSFVLFRYSLSYSLSKADEVSRIKQAVDSCDLFIFQAKDIINL